MEQDIRKVSKQSLRNTLSSLDEYKDYIFWIRNGDMGQQIYTSKSYDEVWGRDLTILYDIPLMWLDYLEKDQKENFMQQLQERHIHGYKDPVKNLVFYQIQKENGNINYLRDQCFRCETKTGEVYIAGASKVRSSQIWHIEYKDNSLLHNIHDRENLHDQEIYNKFYSLLKNYYGFIKVENKSGDLSALENLRQYLRDTLEVSLTIREFEVLYHFCQGKTAKVTAQDMRISYRTVEYYLDNMREKTNCKSKIEMISRFSKYFIDIEIIK